MCNLLQLWSYLKILLFTTESRKVLSILFKMDVSVCIYEFWLTIIREHVLIQFFTKTKIIVFHNLREKQNTNNT